jgi:hypothetical protein
MTQKKFSVILKHLVQSIITYESKFSIKKESSLGAFIIDVTVSGVEGRDFVAMPL